MPFKDFSVGEILTSSDVDTYLMSQVIIRCTSGTRPSSPAEGWHIYETDTQKFMVYKSGAWVPEGSQTVSATKTANETITNSTTLQDDDHLALPLEANTKYWVSGLIAYTAGLGKLKVAWSYPSGTTFLWSHLGTGNGYPSASAAGNSDILDYAAYYENETVFCGGKFQASVKMALRITGYLVVSSTAGSLRLRWAQTDSSSESTILLARSVLRATRID